MIRSKMMADPNSRGAEVIVVGAGHNGLVAGPATWPGPGVDVLVVERWEPPAG